MGQIEYETIVQMNKILDGIRNAIGTEAYVDYISGYWYKDKKKHGVRRNINSEGLNILSGYLNSTIMSCRNRIRKSRSEMRPRGGTWYDRAMVVATAEANEARKYVWAQRNAYRPRVVKLEQLRDGLDRGGRNPVPNCMPITISYHRIVKKVGKTGYTYKSRKCVLVYAHQIKAAKLEMQRIRMFDAILLSGSNFGGKLHSVTIALQDGTALYALSEKTSDALNDLNQQVVKYMVNQVKG